MLGRGSNLETHYSKIFHPIDLLLHLCLSSSGPPGMCIDLLHLSPISIPWSLVLSASSSLRYVSSSPSSVSLPGISAMALLLFATTHVTISVIVLLVSFLSWILPFPSLPISVVLYSLLLQNFWFCWSEFFVQLLFIMFLFLLFVLKCLYKNDAMGFLKNFTFLHGEHSSWIHPWWNIYVAKDPEKQSKQSSS